MARPRQTLLHAVRRAKREHRLTDLLILALASHLGFANRLLDEAGLPKVADVEVTPEVYTRNGRPVDMEVLGYDADGVPVARLWSEHKVGAEWQPDQLPDYATDLPELPARRQLITIVDDLSEVPPDPLCPDNPRWAPFNWRQVAVMAWEAGRDAAGHADKPIWQEASLRPDAPASQRILFELLNYLEEEHGVVLDPLGYETVAAFAHMTKTGAILDELIKRAGEFARAETVAGVKWSNEGTMLWQAFSAAGTWAEPVGGHPTLVANDNDEWSRIGEPALGAGYSLPGTHADAFRTEPTQAWRDTVATDGFHVAVFGGWVRVWRTKYLAELIPLGVTLDTQATEVARWVDETLSTLATHDPGITP